MKQPAPIISGGPLAVGPAEPLDEELDEAGIEVTDAALPAETRSQRVDAALHGQRLDRALVALAPEFSRSYLQQLIEAGAATVNGIVQRKPAAKIHGVDLLAIELRPTLQSQAFRPEPMDLRVVHEDEHLRVIDKPAGLVVHPAPGNWSGTLLNGLLALDPLAGHMPRAGIVHRLDKDTSGLMVVARTRAAMDALVAMIAARDVRRQYLALAHKPWTGPDTRSVDAPMGRDPRNRLRMAVVDLARHPGKPARTDFELLANADAGCLLRCTLHTGRTHQIRVHAASLGHPLVADTLYGGAPAAGLSRQALHAFRLAFTHPITGQALDLRAPLPQDIEQALAQWGLRYNESQHVRARPHRPDMPRA